MSRTRRWTLVTLSSAAFVVVGQGCAGRGRGQNTPYKGVRLQQIHNGTQITAEDDPLLFERGKALVRPEAQPFIGRLAHVLREKNRANVVIENHTDTSGGLAVNQALSEKRALSVRQSLIERGVPASRISARGLGPAQPVASNDTPEGRAANRRTEIFLIGEPIDKLE